MTEPNLPLCLLEELRAGPGARAGVAEALSNFTGAGDSLHLRCQADNQPLPSHVLPLELSAQSFWL